MRPPWKLYRITVSIPVRQRFPARIMIPALHPAMQEFPRGEFASIYQV
jgi:hypothetical protein